MAASEISSAIERSITSQSELITSLSLAVIAGLLALLVQIRIHNATSPSKAIALSNRCALYVALGCAGLSIVLGYALSGALVQMAPQIFSHSFDVNKSFSAQEFTTAPIEIIQFISLGQFIVFCIAVLGGVIFFLKNQN